MSDRIDSWIVGLLEDIMTDYEKIAILDNEIQAQYIEAVLNDRAIPHIMHSYHDMAYNGIFQASKGWGHVAAPKEYREEILTILQELDPEQQNSF